MKHQIWPNQLGYRTRSSTRSSCRCGGHSFTTSKVLPIDSKRCADSARTTRPSDVRGRRGKDLPEARIYGFNGTFPGPDDQRRVRKAGCWSASENQLDVNPPTSIAATSAPRAGLPHPSATTAIRARERRQPQLPRERSGRGYLPGQWCDNLYLIYPAGGDDSEKQSFFWFHDHYMDHTGANVYKGMVGLCPIYDPRRIDWATRPGAAPAGRPVEQPGWLASTSSTTSRWPSTTAAWTTASRPTRTSITRTRLTAELGAPGVVGEDVLPALPQPRLRRRHLHRQRHGLSRPRR